MGNEANAVVLSNTLMHAADDFCTNVAVSIGNSWHQRRLRMVVNGHSVALNYARDFPMRGSTLRAVWTPGTLVQVGFAPMPPECKRISHPEDVLAIPSLCFPSGHGQYTDYHKVVAAFTHASIQDLYPNVSFTKNRVPTYEGTPKLDRSVGYTPFASLRLFWDSFNGGPRKLYASGFDARGERFRFSVQCPTLRRDTPDGGYTVPNPQDWLMRLSLSESAVVGDRSPACYVMLSHLVPVP